MSLAFVPVLATDWQPVVLAIAASIPGIVAAVIAYLNRGQMRTPSGPHVGRQVENSHVIVALNNAYLRTILAKLGEPEPDPGKALEGVVDDVRRAKKNGAETVIGG